MVLQKSRAVLRRSSVLTYRIALTCVLLALLLLGGTALVFQYWLLPNIDDYRDVIARSLSEATGQKVQIGHLRGSWEGYRAQLLLEDVVVVDQHGQEALRLAEVDSVVSWRSLLAGQLQIHSLRVSRPLLLVRRDSDGHVWVAGVPVNPAAEGGGFAKWIFAQQEIRIEDAQLTWLDEQTAQPALELKQVQFRLENTGTRHHLVLEATPPVELASAVKFEAFVTAAAGDGPEAWSGRGSLNLPYADVARWQSWLPLPIPVTSAIGSVRLTFKFDRRMLTDLSADLELVNVATRLGADLPELGLTFVKGQLAWHQDSALSAVTARHLALQTAEGLELPPLDFEARRLAADDAGVVRTELRFSGLSLAPVLTLADRFPLDAGLRRRLAEMAPQGFLADGQLAWEGEWDTTPAFILRAKFSDVTVKPSGLVPGFVGATGSIDASSVGGKLNLATRQASIDMPKVFVTPLPLDLLNAQVDWSVAEGETTFRLRNVAFSNAHVAGVVSGSYQTARQGAGHLDLTGRITRGDGREAWRYVPRVVTTMRDWLKQAVLAGGSTDTRFRVRGNVDDFPFPDDQKGLFEVAVKIEGGAIRFAEKWPQISGIEGDLLFRGKRMELRNREAYILGAHLRRVKAHIADLTRADPMLSIEGEAEGPSNEFLSFVEQSPVAGYIDHVLDGVRSVGAGRLNLALDIPLAKLTDIKLRGNYVFSRNRVLISPKLPAVEEASGKVAFTEHDVQVSDTAGMLFGYPLTLRSASIPGRPVTLDVTGRIDVEQLKQLFKMPWLSFASGNAAWRASVGINSPALRVETDLVGVGVTLPAPFGKPASAALPLQLERRMLDNQDQVLTLGYGKLLNAQVRFGAAGDLPRVEMALGGGAASLPAREGTWVSGALEQLDVEAWRGALSRFDEAGAEATALGVNLRIGSVFSAGRRFGEVQVSGQRQAGRWQLALAGAEVKGDLSWSGDSGGSLTGRFASLSIPPRSTQIQATAAATDGLLPTLDLQVQEFTLEGRHLGQLVLLAVPESAAWRLSKLEVSNPDSTVSITGQWSPGVRPEMHVQMKLQVQNIGRFFTRLQMPEGVRGGTATLEGPLSWAGGPSRIDFPSLYGTLSLHASNGSFVKIEPGIAKLFAILSLQGLARELKYGDVFSRGYTFEEIRAKVSVDHGVMDTQDFRMDGASAKVGIKGQVNLLAETQSLNVRVTPVIGESVSLGTALLINPAIGVGLLIGQKALKDPLDRLLSQEYSVSGSWSEPKIEAVSRAAKMPKDRPSR